MSLGNSPLYIILSLCSSLIFILPSPPSLPPPQVSEFARECLISLTAPVNSPHWIREELRISGGLDILANMGENMYVTGLHHLDSETSEKGPSG